MIRDFLRGCFINGLIAIALVLGALIGIALSNRAETKTDVPVTSIALRFA